MGDDEKQDLSGINFNLIGKKKANKTTPSSSWKLGFPMNNSVSARKIAANLWEVQPQFNFNKHDDDHGGSDAAGAAAASLIHHRRRRHRSHEKKRIEDSDQLDEKQRPDTDPQSPEIETILRSNIRELPGLHHLSFGKNGNDLQHVSTASCCSSMQVTPFVKTATPIGHTVKTSTHVLKILNRIWNLEEKNSLNVALIKTLKRELDISRAQITTLVEERKRDRQEMAELKKSTDDRKKKVVESTRDELLDIKSSLMRERKARILLESLCDEFANGIRDYEQKVRFLQQNRGKKDRIVCKNEPDRLILHVSEAWLDERAQMKCDFSEKTSISDNLCCEIETFLEVKKKQSHGPGIVADQSSGAAEPSSHLMSRMEWLQDHGPVEPSMSRRVARGSGATKPSSKSNALGIDQGPGVAEPRARNTLMAKLLEARLESHFSKSKTLRR